MDVGRCFKLIVLLYETFVQRSYLTRECYLASPIRLTFPIRHCQTQYLYYTFFLISVVRGIGRFDVFVYSVTGSLFRLIILRELFFSIFIEKKEGASPKVYFLGHPLPIMDFFTFLNVYL